MEALSQITQFVQRTEIYLKSISNLSEGRPKHTARTGSGCPEYYPGERKCARLIRCAVLQQAGRIGPALVC